MIEVNWCDDGRLGVDYIGRVQPAPQSHLDDRMVHACTPEVLEGHCRDPLEVSWVQLQNPLSEQLLDGGVNRFESGAEGIVRNFLAAGADALVDPDQVGRSIEARPNTGCPENRLDHGGSGSLSVGSCDVDAAKGILGPAHALEDLFYTVEAQPGGLHLVTEREDVTDGFGVGHG